MQSDSNGFWMNWAWLQQYLPETYSKTFLPEKKKKKTRYIFCNLIINLSHCLNKDNTKTRTTGNNNNPPALSSFSQWPSLLISGTAFQREDYIWYALFLTEKRNCEVFFILTLSDSSISSCPEMHWSLHTSSQTLVICFLLICLFGAGWSQISPSHTLNPALQCAGLP